jgi:hypothetical protein
MTVPYQYGIASVLLDAQPSSPAKVNFYSRAVIPNQDNLVLRVAKLKG